ncbi:hypothetical protein, partial [Sphingobacterium multivorum]|uniref:hypothetical protein n=1 Tax=Sphingobacterium multivorum TaxID=28454 RepID=UPI0028B1EF0D
TSKPFVLIYFIFPLTACKGARFFFILGRSYPKEETKRVSRGISALPAAANISSQYRERDAARN